MHVSFGATSTTVRVFPFSSVRVISTAKIMTRSLKQVLFKKKKSKTFLIQSFGFFFSLHTEQFRQKICHEMIEVILQDTFPWLHHDDTVLSIAKIVPK